MEHHVEEPGGTHAVQERQHQLEQKLRHVEQLMMQQLSGGSASPALVSELHKCERKLEKHTSKMGARLDRAEQRLDNDARDLTGHMSALSTMCVDLREIMASSLASCDDNKKRTEAMAVQLEQRMTERLYDDGVLEQLERHQTEIDDTFEAIEPLRKASQACVHKTQQLDADLLKLDQGLGMK